MKFARFAVLVLAVSSFVAGSGTRADEESHHGEASHGASEPEGLAGAWTALWSAREGIAAEVEAGRLETIHEKAEPIPALAQALLRESGDLEPAKRARLESAVGQIPNVAGGLHEAADAGNADRTRRELKRLDGLLQLIRAQYPAGALPAAPDHHDDAAKPHHDGAAIRLDEPAARPA